MIFSEPRFLAFFLLVFSLHWALRSNANRKHLLLVASLYFYGCWDWRFLFLIVGAATVDWLAAGRMTAARAAGRSARGWLLLSLSYNLLTLGFFKYCGFFLDSAVAFSAWLGLPLSAPALQIVLPVGISFFTFQTLSYSVDVYRGHLTPTRSYLDFLLFVAFFPQLVAGPIVRAADFLPQLAEPRRFANVDVQRGIGQFLSGFIKKSVVADMIARPSDELFAAPGDYTSASIWIGVLCYSIQIYCDFSGYSDMAIGAARLLGYELRDNFRFPYLATSITEFWRRWHMSLSSWLRDYLYISLGGNRGGRWFTHRNLLLTMLLGGLWHGAGWNFVIWGALHGLALVLHKEWVRWFGAGRLLWFARPLTLYLVVFAWIFFRARSWADAQLIAHAFLTLADPGEKSLSLWSPDPEWGLATRAAGIITPLLLAHCLSAIGLLQALRRRLPAWLVTVLLGAIAALGLSFMPVQARPFIYFQF